MKIFKIVFSIVILVGLSYWIFSTLNANKKVIDENAQARETIITEIPVTVTPVKTMTVDNNLEVIGTFEARKELSVIAETQGRITNLYIEEGQSISKGKLIATIDDAAIQAQLQTAQSSLAKAQKDVERYKNLLDVGAISQTQYEEVSLSLQNQKSNITALEQQLKYTNARSPMSGIVKEVILEEGSFANPGMQIASVVDISKLNMVIKVDEKDIVKIKENQKVIIITEVYPDHEFTGKVSTIGVQADGARKYEVSIELKNDAAYPLKAGMYGTVNIETSEDPKTEFVIPRKSIVGSIKQPQVFLAKDGMAQLKNIEIGETFGENVVVKSGLQEGEQIITTGQINLEDGRVIKIVNQENSLTSLNK